ncbi:XRE family transcriptional regulator [Kiloniella sp.]|uniref:XRE family transcriptional regulator n=1 Tax=Kiloniella sp. TaxID=1938587 RepID=UPI003B02487A
MENRIKEIRTEKGMTLQQVADKAGTTKAQVMKLEKGDRRLTDVWMVRLSLAMSCDPKELMGTSRDSRHLPDEELTTPELPNAERSETEQLASEREIIDYDLNDPVVTSVNNKKTAETVAETSNITELPTNTPASDTPPTNESQATLDANLSSLLPEEKPKGIKVKPVKSKTVSNIKGSNSQGSLKKARTAKVAAPAPGCDPVAEIAVRGGMGGGGEAAVAYSPDGDGNMAIADDVKGNWFLPSDYLRSELSVSPAAARIIEVQGDSMTPTLHSGDRVMIDTNDQRPTPPGIFALWDGIGVVVKRLEHVPNSDPALLRISSDNANHNEYQRTFDEVNIIGRIIWYGRRV